MNDITLKALEQQRDEREDCKRKREERFDRLYDIKGLLLKPKGLFRKSCPKCGNRLKVEHLDLYKVFYTYYSCGCGYEYVNRDIQVD